MNEETSTFETIFSICLKTQSKNPVEIIRMMMAEPFCHMHGPEHHFMVGAALLTAFKNAGGRVNLEEALKEMQNRTKSVPGGACGYWGACGAGISTGMFVSIILKASPLTQESWGQTILMTSRALEAIGKIGGKTASALAQDARLLNEKYFLEVIMVNEFNEYVRDIFSGAGEIVIKSMMGGYLVYFKGKLIGARI